MSDFIRVIIRGRGAWVAGLIFGVLLIIAGIVWGATSSWSASGGLPGWLVGVGAGFAVFSLIFLIMSFASRGQTD